MLETLSGTLKNALKKLVGRPIVDREAVDELVKEIQRALLSSDVNVKLVMNLSQEIRKRALDETLQKNTNPRDHVLKIVYQEMVKLVGSAGILRLEPQKILMAGLQGSGKTTTTAKIARYFQKKGMRVGVICADTFRPGAYEQLSTLCQKIKIPCFGRPGTEDARGVVREGLESMKEYQIILIDTQGRHALEDELIHEIIDLNKIIEPTHRWLVIDAALGQQARDQAKRFHEAIGIDGVIITKMDGTAKGGGALSAVAETESGIVFIGSGETSEDLEIFDPERFISLLLGMGDLSSFVEKITDAISKTEDLDVNDIMTGKFTLRSFYQQIKVLQNMGSLKSWLSSIPSSFLPGAISQKIPDEIDKTNLKRHLVIMDSMHSTELDDHSLINSSRLQRISRGAGAKPEEVRELLRNYKKMQKTMRHTLKIVGNTDIEEDMSESKRNRLMRKLLGK